MHSILFFSGGKDSVATREILHMQGITTTLVHLKEMSADPHVTCVHEVISDWIQHTYDPVVIWPGDRSDYCEMLAPVIKSCAHDPVVLSNGEADQWPEIGEFGQIYQSLLCDQVKGIYNPWLWMNKHQLFHLWHHMNMEFYVYKTILHDACDDQIKSHAFDLLGTCVNAAQLAQIHHESPQLFYSLQTLVVQFTSATTHVSSQHIVPKLNHVMHKPSLSIQV